MEGMVSALFQRSWWSYLIKGLVAAVFGIIAVFSPGALINTVVVILGIILLIIGIVAAAGALMHRSESKAWVWLMVPAIVAIVAGIICVAAPTATTVLLAYLIGIWAVVNGVIEIYNALKLRKDVAGEWVPFLVGLVSILFGIVLFVIPRTSAELLVRVIGIFVLALGILWLSVAYRSRKWQKPPAPTP